MVSVFILLPLIHYLILKHPKIESHLVGIAGSSHSKRPSTISESPSSGTYVEDTPTRDSTENSTTLQSCSTTIKVCQGKILKFSALNIFTDKN
jgi:hypothetical protein